MFAFCNKNMQIIWVEILQQKLENVGGKVNLIILASNYKDAVLQIFCNFHNKNRFL